jgi:hypothetical protein
MSPTGPGLELGQIQHKGIVLLDQRHAHPPVSTRGYTHTSRGCCGFENQNATDLQSSHDPDPVRRHDTVEEDDHDLLQQLLQRRRIVPGEGLQCLHGRNARALHVLLKGKGGACGETQQR